MNRAPRRRHVSSTTNRPSVKLDTVTTDMHNVSVTDPPVTKLLSNDFQPGKYINNKTSWSTKIKSHVTSHCPNLFGDFLQDSQPNGIVRVECAIVCMIMIIINAYCRIDQKRDLVQYHCCVDSSSDLRLKALVYDH